MTLPSDIKKFIYKQMLKSALFFLIFLLIAVVLLYAAIPSLSEYTGTIPIVLLCIGFFVLAAYFSKIFSFIFDRNWMGKVLDVKVETKTGSYSYFGKTGLCEKNTILLTVEKENGKSVPVKAVSFVTKSENGENVRTGIEYHYSEHVLRGNPETFLKKYHKGDTVYHFRGLKENLYVSETYPFINCVVCGAENATEKDACYHCHHSLIKP